MRIKKLTETSVWSVERNINEIWIKIAKKVAGESKYSIPEIKQMWWMGSAKKNGEEKIEWSTKMYIKQQQKQ